MSESNKKTVEEIIEKIRALSPENQKAMTFVMENYDLINKMCEKSNMTDEDIQKWEEKAKVNNDYIMSALLAFVRVYNDKKK